MNDKIRAMLMKKNGGEKPSKLLLRDVNKDLIVALLAVPVYGKDARDEDILSIIINPGSLQFDSLIGKIKSAFETEVKAKNLKKSKDGFTRDKDGFIHLKPR